MKEKISQYYFLLIDLLMITLGVIGLVGGFMISLGFPSLSKISIIGLIIYAGLLYRGYRKDSRYLRLSVSFFFGLLIIFLLCIDSSYIAQFSDQLLLMIEKDYFLDFSEIFVAIFASETLLPMTLLFLIGMPIAFLIVSLICNHTKALLKIIICFFIYLFPAYILHPLTSMTSYCFLIFIFYEFIFGYVLRYQKGQAVLKTIVLAGLIVILLFSNIVLQSNPIFQQTTSQILANLRQTVDTQRITGTSTVLDGSLPTGNIRLGTNPALKVSSTQPVSTYFRAYSLAYYEDNEWHEATEDYRALSSTNLFTEWISTYFYEEPVQMSVESMQQTVYQFVPYFASMPDNEINDSYYLVTNEEMTVFPVYSDLSTYIAFDETISSNESYNLYVNEQYLYVPISLKIKLIYYMDIYNSYDTDMSGMKLSLDEYEIIEEVKRMLADNTTYSLNAGPLPDDMDFVEYFLYDNQRGSCTHYATSAALMLRCFDIPTRFVRGYVVKESDFNNQNEALIRSSRSHAWIEVYIQGKGWIPIEVTPTSANSGSDATNIADMIDRQAGQQDDSTQNEDTQTENVNPIQTQQQDTDHKESFQQIIDEYGIYILSIGVLFIVVVGYRVLTHQWLKIKLRGHNTNESAMIYYQRMKKVLSHFGGEIDEKIEILAYKAKFSQHELSKDEIATIKKQYHLLINDIYKSLPIHKKLLFKYILGYK